MDLGLKGKTVLITGGSKGIGLACGEAFAAAGCSVVLAARDPAQLAAAAETVGRKHPARVQVCPVDLAAGPDRERLHAVHPGIDILINNAGAIPGGNLLDMSMERWQEAWQLKVFGYIHLTQLYMRSMKERKAGTIVNIIGMAGVAPRWDYICGATGNAGLIAFTKAVGAASVDWGVRVFGINPSATRTDRIMKLSRDRAKSRFGDEARWEETLGNLPFGRLAEPEEVAHTALFLSSPKVTYLSGTVIDLDGGGHYRG